MSESLAQQLADLTREHDEFVNDILAGAPDSYDCDDAAETIAIRYVRHLEEMRAAQVAAVPEAVRRWIVAE